MYTYFFLYNFKGRKILNFDIFHLSISNLESMYLITLFSATKSQDHSDKVKRLIKNGIRHRQRMRVLGESTFYS